MSLNHGHKSSDALGSVKEPLIAAAAAAVTQQVEHGVDLDKENMRYLWTPPTLFQDWDEEYEERTGAWWELFVDLVFVAACSNIADGFKEDPTSAGFGLFALQLMVYYTLWNQYVGYSSRFRDDSLGHSVLLFIYIAGAACMVVHSGAKDPADILGFSVGMILQKGAMLLMQAIVYIWIPRARVMTGIMLAESVVFFVCIGAAAGFPDYAGGNLALAMWGTVLVTEQIFRLGFGLTCGKQILPINIDHFTDRMGCCVMVILGESIVSESISYRALPQHARTTQYYGAALLGLLMTFGIALIYFHLQPLRERHAFRVSRYRGMLLEYGQRSLGVALLAVGVGIKFAMAAVVGEEGEGEGQNGTPTGQGSVNGGNLEQERAGGVGGLSRCDPSMMSPLRVWVLLGALSCVMASLFVQRLAHYGGVEPRSSDATGVYRLKMLWWLLVGSNCIPPLVAAGVLTGGSITDGCTPVDDARGIMGEAPEPGTHDAGLGTHPLTALAAGAGCTVGVVCLESIVTHILKDTVLVARARRAGGGTVSGDLIAEWLVEPDGGSLRKPEGGGGGDEQEGGDELSA